MVSFNPVRLIEELKKRPGLWSTDHPMDREQKLNLWKDVGASIYRDWDQCNKATAYDRVLQLQRKWRSLRDAYGRELRARRSGVRINKRVYIYFKRMSFLGGFEGPVTDEFTSEPEPDGDLPLPEDNPENTDNIEDDPLFNQITSQYKKKKIKKRKLKKSIELHPPEEVEVNFPMDADDDSDSDKLFLLSFAPGMRQLPVNIKMWVRAQIASVMQEAVSCHYNNTIPGLGVSSERNFDVKMQRRDSSE